MSHSRRLRATAIITGFVAVALTLASCSSDDPAPRPSEGGSAGGDLIFLDAQFPPSFQIARSTNFSAGQVVNQVVDRLTYQDPETLEILPWLAEKWEVNDDATSFTFFLREGVTFSDGTPLDAEAVKANFDLLGLGDETLGITASDNIVNYVSGTVVDDLTVRFDFSAPSVGFLQATSLIPAGIVAPSTLALPYEEQSRAENLIGSGPFVIDDYEQDQEVVLVRRDDYDWAPPSLEHQGAANLESITYLTVPDNGVRLSTLLNGEAQIARSIQPTEESRVTESGYTIAAPTASGEAMTLYLRPTNPLLSDERVRKAIQRAIDVPDLLTTVFTPSYVEAGSVLTRNSDGFVAATDAYAYDQDEAKELLDDAGWEPAEDGVREKDGERLELTVYVSPNYLASQQALELLGQQLAEVGIALDIRNADLATNEAANADPLQTPLRIMMNSRADLDGLSQMYLSSGAKSVLKLGDEDAARVDDLLGLISSTSAAEERNGYAADLQNLIVGEGAWAVPLYDEVQTFAIAPEVEGIAFEPTGRSSLYAVSLDG